MEAKQIEGKRASQSHTHKKYNLESQLHRAWAALAFERQGLATIEGKPLRILNPGTWNPNQGPDFLHATIEAGGIALHGDVELHLSGNDWEQHGHHRDSWYNGVVLHVYLRPRKRPTLRADGSLVMELCLGDRVEARQETLLHQGLACSLTGCNHLPRDTGRWLEEMGTERLQDRAKHYQERLFALRHDWSQLLWEAVATALGGPVNAFAFHSLATHMPWSLMRKYAYSPSCLEALLFGASGLLEGVAIDSYHGQLKTDWFFFQRKHRLRVRTIDFRSHRMHPSGSAPVRIAQLAAVAAVFRPLCGLLEEPGLRSFLKEGPGVSAYWQYRYGFGNSLCTRPKELGKETRTRVVVNALAPLTLLAASVSQGKGYAEAAATSAMLLKELPAENNRITRLFGPLGLVASNALQSQGLMALHRGRCSEYRCLDCVIGQGIVSSKVGLVAQPFQDAGC